jgi:hypothetical protein
LKKHSGTSKNYRILVKISRPLIYMNFIHIPPIPLAQLCYFNPGSLFMIGPVLKLNSPKRFFLPGPNWFEDQIDAGLSAPDKRLGSGIKKRETGLGITSSPAAGRAANAFAHMECLWVPAYG